MSSGKKQFVLFAIAASLFSALMITGVAGNVAHGNYSAIPIVGFALALAAFVIWFSIWFNRRRIRFMFQDPTPDRLIAHYHATVLHAGPRRIPHADAAAAYLSALAATVYGQFDRAREELGTIDWEKTPAMYRGHRAHVLALIALLEGQDQADALRLAAEAQALEKTDPAGGMPILHSAILVAAGEAGEDDVERTRRAASGNAGAMPAICAWALSLHFERSGQGVEAARYRDQLGEAAPHFVGSQSHRQ